MFSGKRHLRTPPCGHTSPAGWGTRAKLRNLLLLAVTLALMLPALGAADNTQRFEDLGHKMMCTCSCGQILLECNHVGCPNSDGMRQDLLTAVASTQDDQQIINTFIKKYGPTVMAAPVFVGFNRVAWIMPFAVLIFGIVGSVLLLRMWRKRRLDANHPNGGVLVQTVAEDVRKRIRDEVGE